VDALRFLVASRARCLKLGHPRLAPKMFKSMTSASPKRYLGIAGNWPGVRRAAFNQRGAIATQTRYSESGSLSCDEDRMKRREFIVAGKSLGLDDFQHRLATADEVIEQGEVELPGSSVS
jgi:hypothetical protein